MLRGRWWIFLLLLVPFAFADVCIYKFANHPSFQIMKSILDGNVSSPVRTVDSLDFAGCDVVIVNQEMRNQRYPLFNENLVADEIRRTGPNVIVIKNAIWLYKELTGHGNICTRRWYPGDHDIMGIVVKDNSTILSGWPIGERIRSWTQFPGRDDDAYFCGFVDGRDGHVIGGFYTCYWGSCSGDVFDGRIIAESNYTTDDGRERKVLVMVQFRFSPEYNPSDEAIEIFKRAVRYMLGGSLQAEIREASWNRDLIVEYWGSYCENNSLSSLVVEGEAAPFTLNYFRYLGRISGKPVFRFSAKPNSTWFGNLSVSFTDRCGNSGNILLFRNLTRRARMVFVVQESLKDMYSASVLGSPVIVLDNNSEKWGKAFIKEYDTDNVACIGTSWNECTIRIKRKDLYRIFPVNGLVTISPDWRSAYVACAAALNGSGVEFSDENGKLPIRPDEHAVWFAGLPVPDRKLGPKYFAFGNTSLAGLAPLLCLHGYLPVYTDKGDPEQARSEINTTIFYQKILYVEPAQYFNNISILIAGLPPFNETVEGLLGPETISTYYPYMEIEDAARLSTASEYYHIIFPLFLKPKPKALIVASYKLPDYIDILPNGMDFGFFTEMILRLAGFETRRFIENKIELVDVLEDFGLIPDLYLDMLNDDFHFKLAIEEILEEWGLGRIVKIVMAIRRLINEVDWFRSDPDNIILLSRINATKISNLSKKYDIFFYFGVGNSTHLNLPEDKDPSERATLTNPYPGTHLLSPSSIHSWVQIILSNSSAEGFDAPVFVGYRGKERMRGEPSLVYGLLKAIYTNSSLSMLYRYAEENLVPYEDYGEKFGTLLEFLSLRANYDIIQTIHITEVRGLPEFKIDPPFSSPEKLPVLKGRHLVFEDRKDLEYEIVNGTPIYSNMSGYVWEDGLPPIQYLNLRYVVHGRIEDVNVSMDVEERNITDEIGNRTSYPPEMFGYGIRNLSAGNKEVAVVIAPVRYTNSTDYLARTVHIRIVSDSVVRDTYFREGKLVIVLKSEMNYSVDGKRGSGREIELYPGLHVVEAWNRTDYAKFRAGVEFDFPDLKVMRRIVEDGPEHSFRKVITPFYSISVDMSNSTLSIRYSAIGYSLEMRKAATSVFRAYRSPEGEVEHFRNMSEVRILARSPNGVFRRIISNGSATDSYSGRKEVIEDANYLLSAMENATAEALYLVSEVIG